MDLSGDDLAGVVDLFGAVTRTELREGLAELAFKRGEDHDPGAFEPVVDDALDSYHLVAVDAGAGDGSGTGTGTGTRTRAESSDGASEPLLVVGPVAFPTLPEGAADLPHILEVPDREVDRGVAGRAAEERFRADAASAIETGDDGRVATLLDVSYELEAWGPVDLSGARSRLDSAAAGE
jgi:hypothetical protein